MSDRDAAGINSPHNACMFRKDAEIARLRKVLGWVDGEWHDCEICKQLDVKNAEIARLRDVLAGKGFVECGIPACDCGSWHHRYGLPERWAEIKEVLIHADVLNNDTGNMPLNAIKKLISQLAERDEEIARLREDAERYRWLRPRIHGFDADVCHGGLGVVFKFPENTRVGVGASLDAAIDAARKESE